MPTFSDVHPGDPMAAQNVQQIIDALKGTPGKGVPLADTAVSDATNYALTVQNIEATNSRALSVLKSDGTPLITVNASGVTLGSPLNLATGAITSAAILDGTIATADLANGAVTNVKLGTDTARLNLLVNGGFEIWQRGTPFSASGWTADRWNLQIAAPDTASISKAANYDNAASATLGFTITHSSGNVYLQQPLKTADSFPARGRYFSATLRVYSSVANSVRISLSSDGTGGTTSYSAYNQLVNTWETVSVTYLVPTDATSLTFFVNFGASCTGYLHNAMLVVGNVAADYAPMHPADDLARCLRYYERFDAAGTQPIAAGMAFSTTQIAWVLPLKVAKAITPSVTSTAGGTFAVYNSAASPVVCTSIAPNVPVIDRIAGSAAVGSGLVAGNGSMLLGMTSQTASLFVEANP